LSAPDTEHSQISTGRENNMRTNKSLVIGAVFGLLATLGSACSKPLEVEADAQHEAEKWAARQGWVATEVHCNPRFETKQGLWSCYAGSMAPRVSAVLFCEAGRCVQRER
jgi:hypothetical protein